MLFAVMSGGRRLAYRRGWLHAVSVGVPVIVVGNITAGGSGKTPLVIWLVNWLRSQGYRPGVVSRGYGGTARGCVEVQADSPPAQVGDEPVLIRLKTDAPVVVGRDRVAAARMLLECHSDVDVIVSDDGLQHYRLRRDIELAVIDATTGLGNGWPLPAGRCANPLPGWPASMRSSRWCAVLPSRAPIARSQAGGPTTVRDALIACAPHRKSWRYATCRRTTGLPRPG